MSAGPLLAGLTPIAVEALKEGIEALKQARAAEQERIARTFRASAVREAKSIEQVRASIAKKRAAKAKAARAPPPKVKPNGG